MKKRIIPVLLAALMCVSLFGCKKEQPSESVEINGREWIAQQEGMNDEYLKISEGTEEIYSLYVAGKMSADDFLTEIEIAQKQLLYVQSNYENEKAKIIIDPTSNEVSLKGISALEALYTDMNDLYLASVDSAGVPYSVIEISYIYMNYKEKILDDYIKYRTAVEVLDKYNDDGTPKETLEGDNSNSINESEVESE